MPLGERLQNLGARVDRVAPAGTWRRKTLLWADDGDAMSRAIGQVAQANVVILATPVYKAANSGLLKVFLDVLPQDALRGKTVLPLATGGSADHMLAVDYALRPVLQSLAPRHAVARHLRHRCAGHPLARWALPACTRNRRTAGRRGGPAAGRGTAARNVPAQGNSCRRFLAGAM